MGMNTTTRRALAVFVPSLLAGVVLYFETLRPGYGVVLVVVAIALFAAGGIDEQHRLLWVPFALVGAALMAINFTSLAVPSPFVGAALALFGVAVLAVAVARERLGRPVENRRG